MTTVILGGGLSGLTLARLLKEKGQDVIGPEAEQDYGGLCRSTTEQGFTFDRGGSHIIFSRDTEVLEFMRRMIAGNEQRNNRNTRIFYKQQYVKYPFENGLSDLPPEDRFFCINGFIKNLIAVEKGKVPHQKTSVNGSTLPLEKALPNVTWYPIMRRSGNSLPITCLITGSIGRIPRPPVEDIIRSAIGIETEGYTHQSVFSYPLDGGIEALVRAIARPIEHDIRAGFKVTSIKKSGNQWQISNGKEVILADKCICTIPVQHLLACLTGVPVEVKNAVQALKYNSLVCVNIGIRGAVPPISWLYVPDPLLGKTNRISFPSGFQPACRS